MKPIFRFFLNVLLNLSVCVLIYMADGINHIDLKILENAFQDDFWVGILSVIGIVLIMLWVIIYTLLGAFVIIGAINYLFPYSSNGANNPRFKKHELMSVFIVLVICLLTPIQLCLVSIVFLLMSLFLMYCFLGYEDDVII